MQQIPINAIPNQELALQLDDVLFDIFLRYTQGVMSMTILINNILTIENLRVVAGQKVIPSLYEESGNFIFITQNFELPDYTKFGVSQILVYASVAELAVIRAPTPPPITTVFFNPIAALPLRFAPQGY